MANGMITIICMNPLCLNVDEAGVEFKSPVHSLGNVRCRKCGGCAVVSIREHDVDPPLFEEVYVVVSADYDRFPGFNKVIHDKVFYSDYESAEKLKKSLELECEHDALFTVWKLYVTTSSAHKTEDGE